MQVNTNSIRTPATGGVSQDTPKVSARPPTGPQFEGTDSLNAALKETPEVRRAEVERATRLVESAGYPPPELIHRLSRLLADVVSEPGS
jgi:hypothetical protein